MAVIKFLLQCSNESTKINYIKCGLFHLIHSGVEFNKYTHTARF